MDFSKFNPVVTHLVVSITCFTVGYVIGDARKTAKNTIENSTTQPTEQS